MIVAAFFIALVLCTAATNKKNNAQATDKNLEFERSDALLIFACMLSSLAIQAVLPAILPQYDDVKLPIAGGLLLAYSCIMVLVNMHREHKIQREHDQILKVYQSMADILGNVQAEDVDFAKIPFSFEEDAKTGSINKIIIDTTKPGLKINDNSIIYAQYSLNKYFPDLQWVSEHDAPNRQLVYEGLPKPPGIAHWPWSDYRPSGWIPLGLAGGPKEICWNLADEKKMGMSSYVDEDGHQVDTLKLPSAPQCMTLGSTGGGKAIALDQIVYVQKGGVGHA